MRASGQLKTEEGKTSGDGVLLGGALTGEIGLLKEPPHY